MFSLRFSLVALMCALIVGLAGSAPAASASSFFTLSAAPPWGVAGGNGFGQARPDAYGSEVLNANPIAYYRLNDLNATMVDTSVHHLSGSYGGNVRHGGEALISAGSYSSVFPGVAATTNVPVNAGTVTANQAFATAQQGITVEAWIKARDWNRTSNYEPLVSYGRDAQGEAWILELSPQSGLQFFMKVNGSPQFYILKAFLARIVPAQVYQVAATYDGSHANLYVNGTLEESIAARGTINYSGIAPQYGLAVGGALGGTRPIFNGEISNVAIYPTALSHAQIENHFLLGHIAGILHEKPGSSDAFVDSIGINTHLADLNSSYVSAWPIFQTLMRAAGIRHIRDTLDPLAQFGPYAQRVNTLGSLGIHSSLVTAWGQTGPRIAAMLRSFSKSVEAVEGLNEPDDRGVPASVWVPETRRAQQILWSTVRGSAVTRNLIVIGPAVIWEANAAALGDLSSSADRGNIHDYFGGYNPGTTGWGPLDAYGIYGSIRYNLNVGRVVSGPKSLWATESGYSSRLPAVNTVDAGVLARYVPRMYLENFMHLIYRTTMYEFYDNDANTLSSNFGIVGTNNVPKPSYYAIKSLTSILGDRGPGFNTTMLAYVLGGNTANVAHLLLQKRDGTYELLLWVETQSYDPILHVDLTVPAQSITLQLPRQPPSAVISTIRDSGIATTNALAFEGGLTHLSIDDHVSIITFK